MAGFVQSVVAQSISTDPSHAKPIITGVAAGNTLIVKVATTAQSFRTFTAVSDLNGALTLLVSQNPSSGTAVGVYIFWLPVASAGAHEITIVCSASTIFFEACVEEWNGIDTTVTPITGANTGASGLSHYCAPSGSIDTTRGSALTCCGSINVIQSSQIVGAGYTRIMPAGGGAANQVMFQYRSVLTGAVTDDRGAWTATGSNQVAQGCMVALAYLIPEVIKSIGTSGRNYSTITLWEADLDVTSIYAINGHAIGECYDDSAFDESITLNGGTTVGLWQVTLRPAAGEGHDGTAGTGVRIVASAGRTWLMGVPNLRVEQIDFNSNGLGSSASLYQLSLTNGAVTPTPGSLHRLLLHGLNYLNNTSGTRSWVGIEGNGQLQNSVVYDGLLSNNSTGNFNGVVSTTASAQQRHFNNTVHKIVRNSGSGAVRCVVTNNSNVCRNVIATGAGGTTSGVKNAFAHPSVGSLKTHNLCDDAGDVDQTSSINNAVVADIYVSTVTGSEDLRLKTGAPAIDVGVDLGTTTSPNGSIDLVGFDRDPGTGIWDIGAHEFNGTPGVYALDVLVASVALQGKAVSLAYVTAAGPAPLAYWPLNEGTGTVLNDASGHGHTATRVNGTWESVLAKFGGWAIKNTQSGTGITHAVIDLDTVHSIAWWMDGYTQSTNGDVFNGGGSTYIYFWSNGFLYYNVGGGVSWDPGVLTGSHHWCITRNDTSITAYKDGVSLGTLTLPSNNVFAPIKIAELFNGVLDDVRYYDIELSAADVAALYTYNPDAGGTAHSLDVLPASLLLTGSAVGLEVGYALDALSAALTLTGASVGLDVGRALDAQTASLAITGQTVSLDYAGAATLPNPIAYWPFNEGTGTTAVDASGNFHDATLVLSTWNSALAKFGGFAAETALTGSGVGLHVNSPFSIGTVHSISWWMDGRAAGNSGNIFNNDPIGPPYSLCYFDGFYFYYTADGSDAYVFGGDNFGSHHWVLTRNGTAFAFYRDGVLAEAATLPSDNPFFVYDLFKSLTAVIDDLRIYDVALSATQVAALYALVPLVNKELAVLPAALSLTGTSAGLEVGRVLDALPTTLTIQAYFVSLDYMPTLAAYELNALPVALVLSGQTVNLDYAPINHYELIALQGSLALQGQPVLLDFARQLATLPASLAILGKTVQLQWSGTLPDPFVYWPLNEGSGSTSVDATGNGHLLTLDGTARWDELHQHSGPSGLTGLGDAPTGRFAPIDLGTVHSISLWYYGGSPTHTAVDQVSFLSGSDSRIQSWFSADTGRSLIYHKSNAVGGEGAGYNFPDGALVGLHHIVVVRDNLSVIFYVDGVASPPQTMLGNDPFGVDKVGEVSFAEPPYQKGTLDEVRIYNLALSPIQVALLYGFDPLPLWFNAHVGALTLTPFPISLDLHRHFVLDALVAGLTITPHDVGFARTYMLWADPEALRLESLPVELLFKRGETGWDTALHPPLGACRKTLTGELHPSGEPHPFGSEALHPEVKGSLKGLSDATHPRGAVAQPFPLKRKDC